MVQRAIAAVPPNCVRVEVVLGPRALVDARVARPTRSASVQQYWEINSIEMNLT